MFRVFNCGIGMVIVVAESDAERALTALAQSGETAWRIGVVEKRTGDAPQTVLQ
jgi:phosphoribosylformylglycinamidine cyclo-ligase